MSRERLTADEMRNLEEGTYIVVDLHDDEYWMQGEGRVQFVKEYDSGEVHVGYCRTGHPSRLKIPADAREGLWSDGTAKGARNLRVDAVYALTHK